MRGIYFYIVIGILAAVFTATLILNLAPGFQMMAGVFLCLAVAIRIMDLEMLLHSPRLHAPGLNTPISNVQPMAVVELPGIKDGDSIKKYHIYKNHGNHYIPNSGGGESGYTAVPAEYVFNFEGENSSVLVNCELDIYRQNPDDNSGEIDITCVPEVILNAVKNLSGWKESSPIWFGYFPWNAEFIGDLKAQVELKKRVDILESNNKQLSSELKDAHTRLTANSRIFQHQFETKSAGNQKKRRILRNDEEDEYDE